MSTTKNSTAGAAAPQFAVLNKVLEADDLGLNPGFFNRDKTRKYNIDVLKNNKQLFNDLGRTLNLAKTYPEHKKLALEIAKLLTNQLLEKLNVGIGFYLAGLFSRSSRAERLEKRLIALGQELIERPTVLKAIEVAKKAKVVHAEPSTSVSTAVPSETEEFSVVVQKVDAAIQIDEPVAAPEVGRASSAPTAPVASPAPAAPAVDRASSAPTAPAAPPAAPAAAPAPAPVSRVPSSEAHKALMAALTGGVQLKDANERQLAEKPLEAPKDGTSGKPLLTSIAQLAAKKTAERKERQQAGNATVAPKENSPRDDLKHRPVEDSKLAARLAAMKARAEGTSS